MQENILTYEQLINLFIETSNQIQETNNQMKETDFKIQETDRLVKQLAAESQRTEKVIKELSRNLGGIGTSNGDVAESLFTSTLEKSLSLNGWKFESYQLDVNKFDKKLKIREQYDLLLEKEDSIAVIEIKYKLKVEHIKEIYSKKLPNFRKLFPHLNHKKLIGVAAGLSVDKQVLKVAENCGIYVITLKGDEIKVINSNYKEY